MDRKRKFIRERVQKHRCKKRALIKWEQVRNAAVLEAEGDSEHESSDSDNDISTVYQNNGNETFSNKNTVSGTADLSSSENESSKNENDHRHHVGSSQESDELFINNNDDDDDDEYYSHDDHDARDESDEDLENLLENSEIDEEEQIREWALTGNIPLILLTQLLLILRKRLLPGLPKKAATFLGLNKPKFNIVTLENSFYKSAQFVYFGIAKGLAMCFNPMLHNDGVIYLDINIDGAALYRSSANQFWPILCRIHHSEQVYDPFPVSIYMGSSKPQNLDLFFDEFNKEMNHLLDNGILLDGKLYRVKMKCWILDTPARALVKCTKGHTGFYCCERCEIRGERCNGRTVFTTIDSSKRTNESFRKQSNPEHHTGKSSILSINDLNMITMFVLDFMHLGFLGITKKLLDIWINGPISKVKFSFSQKEELDFMLETIKNQVPIEFQRKTQSIKHIAHWKATQYGFFLLYGGVVILKQLLSKQLYQHFLLLFTGCRILCSNELALRYNTQAKVYLERFVLLIKECYGGSMLTINFHNLVHIADDVKFMNCNLNKINSFSFESLLGKMQKTLRTGYRPLEQLCNRMHQMFFVKKKIPTIPQKIVILKETVSEDPSFLDVFKINYMRTTLTTKSPNNTVLLNNDICFEIRKMIRPITGNPDSILLEGVVWEKEKPFFTFPTNSATLGIWKLHNKPKNTRKRVSINDVKKKIVKLSVKKSADSTETVVTLPLLH